MDKWSLTLNEKADQILRQQRRIGGELFEKQNSRQDLPPHPITE